MSLVVNNRRKRISTGTTNRKRAELIHAKVIGDIQSGKWFEQHRAGTLTFEELAAKYLEKYCKQRDGRTIRFLLPFFGKMKLSEITPEGVEDYILLTWADNIDLKRRLVTVQATKGGRRKTIPISDRLYIMLSKRWLSRTADRVFPYPYDSIRHFFDKAVRLAGLGDFHFHDLRYTFATRLVQSGIDLYRVKELLGHRTVTTTERYAHHYPESLRSAVKVLDDVTFGHALVTVS